MNKVRLVPGTTIPYENWIQAWIVTNITKRKEIKEEKRREKNWSQKKHEEKVFGGDTGIDADFGYDDIPEGLKRAKELSQEAIKEGMESSYKK